MKFEYEQDFEKQGAIIKVLGIGGAGGNAINRMIEANMKGVEFIAINTDAQDLADSRADTKLQIGQKETKGLGTGAKTEIAKRAVKENVERIEENIRDADMVFITAGMGGGTGTGASPTVARLAQNFDCLTVAIVTIPFDFEGPNRAEQAHKGVEELRENVDTLIVIPNQQLIKIADSQTSLRESLRMADNILHQATKGISDLINNHGVINLDFADVKTVMENKGDAIMGTGIASGEARASLAAQQAISSPLLNNMSIKGASGLLINIAGGSNLTLYEVDEACAIINEEAGEEADIIVGNIEDDSLGDKIVITVIATGIKGASYDEQLSTIGDNSYEAEEVEEQSTAAEPEVIKAEENEGQEEKQTETTPTFNMGFSSTEEEMSQKQQKEDEKEVPSYIRKNKKEKDKNKLPNIIQKNM